MSSELVVQQQIRLAAAKAGINMFRNNVGACQDQDGRVIRYGLMNDSAALNKQYKSSDLIAIRPVLITPDMVGQVLGVFTAIEVKSDNWVIRINDEHTQAQRRFHDMVTGSGGYAGFAQSTHDAMRILRLV